MQQIEMLKSKIHRVRVTDANDMYRYLCEQGIIVRNRDRELHCSNCLRITVGTPAENDTLLSAMRSYYRMICGNQGYRYDIITSST